MLGRLTERGEIKMKEFSALGNLKLIFGIPCIKVLFLDVAGMTNAHGLLTLRAIIPAEVTQEDVLRCENTPITVSTQDGGHGVQRHGSRFEAGAYRPVSGTFDYGAYIFLPCGSGAQK